MNQPATSTQTQPPVAKKTVFRFAFHDNGMSLAYVFLKNICLSVITVGIYYPWAKTNIRNSLWRSTSFHDARFVYSGTGWELFVGYIKVILVYGLFSYLSKQSFIFVLLFVLAGLILVPYAIVASKRYLLSRTSWRGIRLDMKPIYKEFFQECAKGGLLTLVTLGFYYPIYINNLYSMALNNTSMGSMSVKYNGKGTEIMYVFIRYALASFALVALTTVAMTTLARLGNPILQFLIFFGPMAYVYYLWFQFQAWLYNFRFAHTYIGNSQIGSARGSSNFTGFGLFGVYFKSFLMVAFTFGLALPWAMANIGRYMLSNVAFIGTMDVNQIAQNSATKSKAMGDVVADVLNVGLGI